MKKNVKTLALNKQTIAELESKKILGGLPKRTRLVECEYYTIVCDIEGVSP